MYNWGNGWWWVGVAATLLPTLVRTSLALGLAHPQTKWQGTRKDKGWKKGAIDTLPDLKIQPASHPLPETSYFFERRELPLGSDEVEEHLSLHIHCNHRGESQWRTAAHFSWGIAQRWQLRAHGHSKNERNLFLIKKKKKKRNPQPAVTDS